MVFWHPSTKLDVKTVRLLEPLVLSLSKHVSKHYAPLLDALRQAQC